MDIDAAVVTGDIARDVKNSANLTQAVLDKSEIAQDILDRLEMISDSTGELSVGSMDSLDSVSTTTSSQAAVAGLVRGQDSKPRTTSVRAAPAGSRRRLSQGVRKRTFSRNEAVPADRKTDAVSFRTVRHDGTTIQQSNDESSENPAQGESQVLLCSLRVCCGCPASFSTKRKQAQHEQRLHGIGWGWSCAALPNYRCALAPELSGDGLVVPGASKVCGYCGDQMKTSRRDAVIIDHLDEYHDLDMCDAKMFFTLDGFHQHLRYKHEAKLGKWTKCIEDNCLQRIPDHGDKSSGHLSDDSIARRAWSCAPSAWDKLIDHSVDHHGLFLHCMMCRSIPSATASMLSGRRHLEVDHNFGRCKAGDFSNQRLFSVHLRKAHSVINTSMIHVFLRQEHVSSWTENVARKDVANVELSSQSSRFYSIPEQLLEGQDQPPHDHAIASSRKSNDHADEGTGYDDAVVTDYEAEAEVEVEDDATSSSLNMRSWDAQLLCEWHSTTDRINRWILHALGSDESQATVHRDILDNLTTERGGGDAMTARAWHRALLKYWFLDEAVTGVVSVNATEELGGLEEASLVASESLDNHPPSDVEGWPAVPSDQRKER